MFQVLSGDPEVDLHDERDRELQPAASEGDEDESAFVSDDALMKMLYLATMRIIEKWTLSFPNWGLILGELMVYFETESHADRTGLHRILRTARTRFFRVSRTSQ